MYDILLKNATIITLNPAREILADHSLAIKDGKIAEILPAAELQEADAREVIAGEGRYVFPGLINTHNHLFQSLIKGLGDDNVLSDWLVKAMFPSAANLTAEDAYYGAMVGSLDGLHSGTTTVLDYMHANPEPGVADGVVKAFGKLGIRGILARGYMDNGFEYGTPRELAEKTEDIEKDCQRLFSAYHNQQQGRIKVWIAPGAVWLSTKDSLLMSKRLAEEYNSKIAVHISETPFDREATEKLHGSSDIDVLEELEILGPDVLMVHCVYLTDRDIRMARYFNAGVSHNPVSNMYLSSGVAPIPEMVSNGLNVGLATDGAASNNTNNMLEVMKITALLHKVDKLDPTVITAEKVLEMATIDAAKALGMADEIGSLEKGKKADLFLFNPQKTATATPLHNPVSTLVYSSSPQNVETVVVDGEIVIKDNELLKADEKNVLKKAQKIAEDLSERAGTKYLRNREWRSLSY